MFKNEEIEIKLEIRNITYYRNLGIKIPTLIKNNKECVNYDKLITINIDMLKNGSDQKVEVYCDFCLDNGIENIFYKKYNNLIRDRKNNNGKDRCGSCARKKSGISTRIDFKKVQNKFIQKNLTPIFNDTDYSSNNSKLEFKCNIHLDFKQKISYIGLLYANNPCKFCRKEKLKKKKSEKIYNYFISRGLVPLFSKNENIINNSKVEFKCNIHSDIIQYISYDCLYQTKNGCKICYNRKGENSSNWKGGITPLVRHLRGYIKKLIKEFIINSKYKCEITELKGSLVVHHIHNFKSIVLEALEILNLPIYKEILNYTELEMNLIYSKMTDLHKKYKLVVILKDLHILFHKEYGLKNNNDEQYKNFILRYKNCEFDIFLKEKYKYSNSNSYIFH